jgi:O-antigen/teichoic acid export membrane protein
VLLTRKLSTSDFGSYSFAFSVLSLTGLLFEFGLFVPAARTAALTDGKARHQVIGAALLLYVPIGLAYSATIFAISFWVDNWFAVDAGDALRLAAPIASAFPFILIVEQLSQGVDRLHVASLQKVFAPLLFATLLLLTLGAGVTLTAPNALALRAAAMLITCIGAAIWLRPAFAATRYWARKLVGQAREWGFQVYVGRVLSIGTYNMDVLLLGLWTDPRSVGLYVLAGSVAMASGLPVSGMAAALFPQLARDSAIGRRRLLLATMVGLVCAVLATVLAEPVIRILFSSRYIAAAGLVAPLAFAQFVRGLTSVFNAFLSAHGRGRDLRNAGLVLTVSNLGLNVALIPSYGASGAAWASFFALVANLLAHIVFYRRAFEL